MPSFTLADIKSLKKELSKFVIDEGQTLNKDEKGYIEVVRSVISFGSDTMNDEESSEFTWPAAPQGVEIVPRWLQGWQDGRKGKEKVRYSIAKQSTSGEDPHAAGAQAHERRNGNKRPAQDGPENVPAAKRPRGMNNAIIEFHVEFLLNLLKDKHALANRVVILQQALRLVNAGANPKLVQWHLNHIKKLLPEEEDIQEAADLLVEYVTLWFRWFRAWFRGCFQRVEVTLWFRCFRAQNPVDPHAEWILQGADGERGRKFGSPGAWMDPISEPGTVGTTFDTSRYPNKICTEAS
ncbi:hypothetical protein EV363DRAFT_1160392 [Boletus edulis]|uniref:Uncharacterized protein n=1 Tax=Boletus edulis BED1 TaxID=1328754 RepID=A0AAD4G7V1_BOLED|nr:hypothetical protein EV363DRAFT_1203392 [Boletus edulis]KAF8134207.1 hypothetical protein EV363DRAFT_1160392 [Boletus edulis]KAF8427129.1 hypothetical protein L210DRAFT_3509013 [Boletus edulis BED1]